MVVPDAVFKQNDGKKIMPMPVLRTKGHLKFIGTNTLTIKLTQARLNWCCINMRMLYNMNPIPRLTSSFELSSMPDPFGFEDCPAGLVHIYNQYL